MSSRIWIEVDDLVEYISHGRRPSGIQRLEFEFCKALVTFASPDKKVNFVTFDSVDDTFTVLDWSDLSCAYDSIANGATTKAQTERNVAAIPGPQLNGTSEPPLGEAGVSSAPVRTFLKGAVAGLPPALRYPIIGFGAHQWWAIVSFLTIWRNIGHAILVRARRNIRRLKRSMTSKEVAPGEQDALAGSREGPTEERRPKMLWNPQPGDVLVSFGATWRPEHPERIEKARRDYGVRFAMMFHDIIPLRRPEWVDPNLVATFGSWVHDILPLSDIIFTNSKATTSDVKAYAQQLGFDLDGKIHTLPIGTGFSTSGEVSKEPPESERPLPPPGSYVLVVSTIEPRKNHALLFRVWRYLLEALPRDRVPTLVFAGGKGWLISDFLQQMKNANFLDGKVAIIERPSDAELELLYAGCQYTIYPSFYEGWGLPVTESHAYRRPCLASNRTSIPEAGGDLARYFDPDSAHELLAHVRRLIERPEELKQWQQQVATEFKPTPWADAAKAIMQVL